MEALDLLKSVKEAAQAISTPQVVDCNGTPLAVVPESFELKELAHLLPNPTRKTGRIVFHEQESFADYVKRHAEPGTHIFADLATVTFTAVLNHHASDKAPAGWQDHVAVYTCPITKDWKDWKALHDNAALERGVTQSKFADFIEDHQHTISDPPTTAFLEAVKRFQQVKNVDFLSAVNLDTGYVQLQYVETDANQNETKGQTQLPRAFKLVMSVFQGGIAYSVPGKIRTRIDEEKHKLALMVLLDRPERILEDAFREVAAALKTTHERSILFGKWTAPGQTEAAE